MHNQRIALVISAGVGIIATFLPFMKALFFTVSLMGTQDGSGYLVIASFIICLIVSLIGNPKLPIIKGHLIGVIIAGIIPAVFLLLFIIARSNNNTPLKI